MTDRDERKYKNLTSVRITACGQEFLLYTLYRKKKYKNRIKDAWKYLLKDREERTVTKMEIKKKKEKKYIHNS